MGHVIDELTVNLGLDTKKFREGSRDGLELLNKTSQEADKLGKNIERQTMKMSDAFGIVRKGALGLMGAFVGGKAAAFIMHINTMDAATGRMSRTIGTSVENLSTWQHMIRQVGGEATAATSVLSGLQQEIESVRQGGGMFEGGFASLMNQSGASIRDDADTMLRKIQKFVSGQVESGKLRPEEAATYLRRVPGMNQDMLNLLLGDFKKIEAAARAVGSATDETAAAAEKLQAKFSLMVQAFERFTAKLIPFIDFLFKPTGEIASDASKAGAKGVLGGLDAATGMSFTPGSPMDRLNRLLWGSSAGGTPAGGGGGSRGDRNNNPGNIEYGPFARANGATGSDGRFAVFPDYATGSRAQEKLVQGSSYQGLTLEQFARKYAEGAPAWQKTVGAGLGIGPGDVVDNKDPRLIEAIRRAEGTGARGAAGNRITNSRSSSSTVSSETHIGKIEVNAPNATDASGIAGEIGGAMKRQQMLAPALTGLE